MDVLEDLLRLSHDHLHQHTLEATQRLDACLYQVGLALLAMEQTGAFRSFRCADVVQYAVNHLAMARQKANELVRASRALKELPALREAFRSGRLGWGKIREVTRVATSETEEDWLNYALQHNCYELQRAVTISPRAYRKALAAENRPELAFEVTAGESVVQARASIDGTRLIAPAMLDGGTSAQAEAIGENGTKPDLVPVPAGRRIRVIVEMEPEDYARYERAEDCLRQRLGRRISRVDVLLHMAELVLSTASPEARARLPLVMVVEGESGRAFYETRQGLLPAPRPALERAEKMVLPVSAPDLFDEPATSQAGRRKKIPPAVMRALMARSGGLCETPGCNRGAPLEVHHKTAVSRGGRNSLKTLGLYCDICHDRLEHEQDFLPGTPWSKARARKQVSSG